MPVIACLWLQLMQLSCRSDVPAVMNTLLALHDRCGRWREAYRLVHGPPPPPPPQLQSSSQQPVPLKLDGGVLSSLVELLWNAGSTASCLLALKQFEDVCRAGMFRLAVGVDASE